MATTTEILDIIVMAEDRASAALGTAEAQVSGLGKAVTAARVAMGALGVGAGIALGASVKAAVDFQHSMTLMLNNTTLSAGAFTALSNAVLTMSAQTGTPIAQIQAGIRHITDLGYSLANAMKIAAVANKVAVATGADAGSTMDLVAKQMHDFSIPVRLAANAMNTVFEAAKQSDVTFQDFVTQTSRATNTAAALHVPLVQVDAALSALGRHESLNLASTQLTSFMQKIAAPSKAAQKELGLLQDRFNIPLVYDFSGPGLQAKGLTGVLADLKRAQAGVVASGGNWSQVLNTLIPAMRGGLAAELLLGSASKDYSAIQGDLNATMAGKTNPLLGAFNAAMKTVSQQMKVMGAEVQAASIRIGTALLPILSAIVAKIAPIVSAITSWIGANSQLAAKILATVAVVGTLVGGMSLLSLVLGPMAATVGALALPLVALAAAAAVLYEAWTRDWGGIRAITMSAWAAMQPAFSQIHTAINAVQAAFAAGGLRAAIGTLGEQLHSLFGTLSSFTSGTALPGLAALGARLRAAIDSVDWAGIATTIRMQVAAWTEAAWSWIDRVAPPLLAGAGKVLSQLVTWIGTASAPLRTQIGTWASAFASWVPGAVVQFLRTWPFLLNSILDQVDRALPGILAKVGAWGNAFASWIGPALPGILKGLAAMSLALYAFALETGAVLMKHVATWTLILAEWIAPAIPHALSALGHLMDEFVSWLHSTGVPLLETGFTAAKTALWSWIQAATPPAVAQLKAWGSALARWLATTGVPDLAAALNRGETALWNWIKVAAPEALTQLMHWQQQLNSWIISTGLPGVAAALRQGAGVLWQWIQQVTPIALTHLKSWGSQLARWLATTGIPDLAAALQRGETALWNWIARAIPPAEAQLTAWSTALQQWLRTTGLPALSRALAAAPSVLYHWISVSVPTAEQQLIVWGQALTNWLTGFFFPRVAGTFSAKMNVLSDWIGGAWIATYNKLTGWYDALLNWLNNVGFPGIGHAFVAGSDVLYSWIAAAVNDTRVALGTWLTGVKNDITKAFSNAGTWLLQAGKDVVQGFVNGLKGAPGAIKDAAGHMATGAVDSVKHFLGISSPSTVFRDIGQQTAQGFIIGLQGQQAALITATRQVFGKAADEAATLTSRFTQAGQNVGKALADGLRVGLTQQVGPALSSAAARVHTSVIKALAPVVAAAALTAGTAGATGLTQGLTAAQTAALARTTTEQNATTAENAQHTRNIQTIDVNTIGNPGEQAQQLAAEALRHTKELATIRSQYHLQTMAASTQATQAALNDTARKATADAQAYAKAIAGINGVVRAQDNAHLHDLQYTQAISVAAARDYGNRAKLDSDLAVLYASHARQQIADAAAVKAAQARVSQQKLQQTANEDTASAHAYAVSMAGLTGVKLAQAQLTLTEKEGVATVATLKAQDYTNQKKFATDYAAYILSQDAKVRADQAAITAAQNLVKQQALEGQAKVAQAVVQTAQQQVNSLTGVAQARAVVTLDEKQETLAIAQLKVTDFGNQKKYLADLATLTLQWGATINAAKNNVVTVQAAVTNAAKEAKAQATAALLSIRDGLKNLVDSFTLAVKQGNMVVAQGLAAQITGYEQANAAALKLTPSLISDQSAKDAQTIQTSMATAAKHAETLAKQAATAAKAQATAGLKPLTEQLQLAELQKNRGAAQAAAAAITAYEQANGAALGMDATQTQINAVKMTQAIDKLSTAAAAGASGSSGMVLLRPQATSLGTLQASFGATTAYGGGSNAGTGTAEGGYSQQTATNTASMLDQLTTAVGTLEVIAGNTMPKQIRLAQRRPSHPFVK